MDRSPGFGSIQRLDALLRLDFSTAPYSVNLATEYKSLTHYTKVRSHTTKVLPLLVCMRFQDLFHSLTGFLFAFPSRYWFTIGQSGVFSLGGWSPHIQTRFHVPRPTRHHYVCPFVYGTITLYGCTSQSIPLKHT